MINMTGLIVRSVKPGFLMPIEEDDSWRYVILVNDIEVQDESVFWTAADARYEMSRDVERLREQAGLVHA